MLIVQCNGYRIMNSSVFRFSLTMQFCLPIGNLLGE